jgi:hypothetical protein
MLLVPDACSACRRRPAFSCSHGRTMWKYMTCASVVGRSQRSPNHTGFDRKTLRKYLSGDGNPGVGARPQPDPFDPFVGYVAARLVEDPHLWARAVYQTRRAWVWPGVPKPDSQHPLPESAPIPSGLPDRHRASERGHHPSTRRGKPNGTGWNCPILPILGIG